MIGYDYVLSYEREDVAMSRVDGLDKVAVADYLKLLIHAPYLVCYSESLKMNNQL